MITKIIYFKSALCPRCRATDRRLSELRAVQPHIEIETVEILTNPARVLQEGIWMIPAIIIGNQRWYHAPTLSELDTALREET